MLKAVIFDMDGIVFDTEPIDFEATKKLLKEYNKTLIYEEVIPYLCTGLRNYIKSLAKKKKINESVEVLLEKRRRYFLELLKYKLRVFPGIENLIKELRRNKIKVALATSSSMMSVKINMKITRLNIKLFDVVITSNDIKKFKPNPEIFNTTVKRLKVKQSECIVIEDSIAGVKAAKSAGIKSVGITNSLHKSKLKDADLIIESAKRLNKNKLENLLII